jgi:hypothetical protein
MRRIDLARALALSLVSWPIFLLLSSGHFGWSDDRYSLQAMRAFAETGVANVSPFGNSHVGRNGLHFSKAEIGVKAAGMPGFLAGSLLDEAMPLPPRLKALCKSWSDMLAVLTTTVATAGATGVCALILVTLGVSWGPAALLALLAVMGSPTLELSRNFISTNYGALAFLLAMLGVSMAWRERARGRSPGIAAQHVVGAGCAMLLIMRPTGVLFFPAIGVAWVAFAGSRWRRYLVPMAWAVGAVGLKLWYNHHRSGSFFTSGYAGESSVYFNRGLVDGLLSHLIAPRWSIFANNPLALLAVPAAWRVATLGLRRWKLGRRGTKPLAPLIQLAWMALLIAPSLLLYSKYVAPRAYPTRYLTEIVFALSLPGLAYAARRGRAATLSGWVWRGAIAVLAVVALCLHVGSSLSRFDLFSSPYVTEYPPRNILSMLSHCFALPLEGWEGLIFFSKYPRPDWLVAAIFPEEWGIVSILVYGAASCGVITLATRRWQLNGTSLPASISLWALLLAPVAVVAWTANQRVLAFETDLADFPATNGSIGVEKVRLYLVGDEIVADYLVVLPAPDAGRAAPKSCDTWLMAELPEPVAGASLRKAIALGWPSLRDSVSGDVDWSTLDGGERIWCIGSNKSLPRPSWLVKEAGLRFRIGLTAPSGATVLSEVEPSRQLPPSPSQIDDQNRKFGVRIAPLDFFSDSLVERGQQPPVLSSASGTKALGFVMHNVRAMTGSKPTIELGFQSSTSGGDLLVVVDGVAYGYRKIVVGANRARFVLSKPLSVDANPMVAILSKDLPSEHLIVPTYCQIQFQP